MAYYEERHWREHNKAKKWLTKALLWTLFWTLIGALIFLPLSYLVANGFSDAGFTEVKKFYTRIYHQPVHLLVMYFKWLFSVFDLPWPLPWSYWIPGFAFLVPALGVYRAILENPFYFGPTFFGSGRWANDLDLARMGLLKGKWMVLGKWKGKFLKLPDLFNTLCIASPGCGKTVSVVIPTILEGDGISMIINDPKGELFKNTAGYRATLGPVFKLYWEGVDDPEKGLYWPCWNPMAYPNMPKREHSRAEVMHGIASSMIPDGPEGTDPYWINAGKDAFTALGLLLLDKVEQAEANDYFLTKLYEDGLDEEDYKVLESFYMTMEKNKDVIEALKNTKKRQITLDNYVSVGTWKLVPKNWIGREPSLAMMVDWLTSLQMKYSFELKDRREQGDIAAYSIDPWDIILSDALRESAYFGYDRRTMLELNDLLIMPSKQRSSVLSTALSGLTVFKNGSVRARTSSSDYIDRYTRGWLNPTTGKWEPVTVYLCIPPLDISSTASLTTQFLCNEMMYVDIFKVNSPNHGPYAMMFILDELQALPKIGVLNNCMGVGRWQNASFLLVVQDLSQLAAKYGGEDGVNVIISNTAAKICLGTNNDETASRLNGMIASKTVKTQKVSQSEGIGSAWNSPFIKNISYKYEKDSLMGTVGFTNMPSDKQFVLYQRNANRPISADRANFFEDRKMLEKASIPPPPPMPDYILKQRQDYEMEPFTDMVIDALDDDKKLDTDVDDEEK